MRWPSVVLLMFAGPAFAQTPVAGSGLTRVLQEFEPHPGDIPLRCDVTPLSPALNFAFRFRAGYTFHVLSLIHI